MSGRTIEINQTNLTLLEKAHKKAVESDSTFFDFEGERILTQFAKYAIQHMKNVLCGN